MLDVWAIPIAMIGTGRCFKKSMVLSKFHSFPINSFEYKRPIYAESNQKIEIAIINTARIKPGIAIPVSYTHLTLPTNREV